MLSSLMAMLFGAKANSTDAKAEGDEAETVRLSWLETKANTATVVVPLIVDGGPRPFLLSRKQVDGMRLSDLCLAPEVVGKAKARQVFVDAEMFAPKKWVETRLDSLWYARFIRIKTNASCITACVQTMSGRSFNVEIDMDDTLETLKTEIWRVDGWPVWKQRVSYNQQILEDEKKTMRAIGLKHGATLHVSVLIHGGGSDTDKSDAFAFSPLEKSTQLSFQKDAPSYRMAIEGCNFEGVCRNPDCKAAQKMVVAPHGLCSIELNNEVSVPCPSCKRPFIASTCAFTHCWYRRIGLRANGQVHERPWKQIGDVYERFADAVETDVKAHKNRWKSIRFEMTSLNQPPSIPYDIQCSICTDDVQRQQMDVALLKDAPLDEHDARTCGTYLPCGHFFHVKCIRDWKQRSPSCPLCRRAF